MTRHDELAVKLYIRRLNLSFGSLTPRTHTRRRIWHHTAGTMSTTAIHNYHRNVRGWAGIGYHFHILLDGTIDRGRPIGIIGAHAGGHNSDSIGIAIQGNLMNRQMTAAQKESAENLRAYLDRIYGTLIDQEHRQVGATLCPGTNFVMPTGLPTGNGDDEMINVQNAAGGVWRPGTGKNEGRWWYDLGGGQFPQNGLYNINGKTYHFDAQGWMSTGAVVLGRNRFIFEQAPGSAREGALMRIE